MATYVADLEGDGFLEVATKVHCGVFINVSTKKVHKFRPDEIKQMLEFMDSADTLVFHNGYGYDYPLLKKLYNYEYKGNKVDTLVLSRLLFPDRMPPKGVRAGPHSVESWGVTFGRHKPENEDWSVFTEHMLHRCTEDCFIQLDLYNLCSKRAKSEQWPKSTFKLTNQLFNILALQEQVGWPVDTKRLQRNIDLLQKWIDNIDRVLEPKLPLVLEKPYGESYVKKPFKQDRTLAKITLNWFDDSWSKYVSGPFSRVQFRRVNLASPQELKDFLISEGWVPKEWNYKKDPVTKRPIKDENNNLIRSSPKLNGDDPFDGIVGGIGRLAAKRVQCSSRRAILEGWQRNIRTGSVLSPTNSPTISQRITGIANTGRLTHSGIVNVPGTGAFFGKQMRSVFVAPRGYAIVGTDSAGCQNRMLAGRVGDPKFTDILINGDKTKGTSIHQVNQKAIKDIAGIEVSYGISKNLNYAFMFGAMDKKLGSLVHKGTEAGAKIRQALLSISPGFEKLVQRLAEEWRKTAVPYINDWGRPDLKNGTIRGADGRPIKIQHEKDVLVYVLQSDEAILMQYALCFLYKWLTDKGWTHGKEFMFVANIHDEYQCLVREDLVQQYIPLANKSISHAGVFLKMQCPHVGDSDVGYDWSQTH